MSGSASGDSVLNDLSDNEAFSPCDYLSGGRFDNIVLVELFSGLMPLSLAASLLDIPVAATYFSDNDALACHVAAVNWPAA
eukprot:10244647-Karenia_brevis.AAC.1